jgi:hypothetical protein
MQVKFGAENNIQVVSGSKRTMVVVFVVIYFYIFINY